MEMGKMKLINISNFYSARWLIFLIIFSTFLFILLWFRVPWIMLDISQSNFVPLHTAMEFFNIAVAMGIAIFGWLIYRHTKVTASVWIGASFIGVVILGIFHTLSFPGMPDFITENTLEKAIWFWLVYRFAFAFALLFTIFFIFNKKESGDVSILSRLLIAFIPIVISLIVLYTVIFYENLLPVMFITGQGLTLVKVVSEYLIIVVFLFSFLLFRKSFVFNVKFKVWISIIIVVNVYSELSFTLYSYANDTAMIIGHIYQLVGTVLFICFIFTHLISEPYTNLLNALRGLKESDERLTMFMESATDSFVLLDSKFKIVDANKMLFELFGQKRDGLIGKSIFEFITTLKKHQEILNSVLETGIPNSIRNYSLKIKHDNIYLTIKIFKVVDGIGIIFADITAQKAAEKLHLENLTLEDATRLKSEFVANMSHDLRTPLNAILGYSELLQDQMFGKLNEKQRQQLGLINSSGRTLLSLINDILDISKIEAGKLELNFETLQVEDLVHKIRDANMPMLKEKRQRLDVDVESGLSVWADELRVEQCLNNLLSNAIKFTPDKGRIKITAQKKKGMTEFSVQDTGIGILADKLDEIFQSFYRIDATTKNSGGTGLGLTITQRLVEMMGGNIRVESEEGKGSTFYFTLPTRRTRTGTKK